MTARLANSGVTRLSNGPEADMARGSTTYRILSQMYDESRVLSTVEFAIKTFKFVRSMWPGH